MNDTLTPIDIARTSAVQVLTALREAFEDMAREDIDGDAGTVTCAQVKSGIDAAMKVVDGDLR